jgi:hypothetical protein
MDNSNATFTPPDFVELPPVETIAVVREEGKIGLDVSYASPDGRRLTIRVVLNTGQAHALSEQLAGS